VKERDLRRERREREEERKVEGRHVEIGNLCVC